MTKIITKEYKVFSFSELEEKAQIRAIEQERKSICESYQQGLIYKTLDASYDYAPSDEAISQQLQDSDYEFLENGEKFYN